MFEFPTIQQRGFRNVRESGQITGFQVPIRSKYYRGLWMSQLRPAKVTVDGTAYEGDQVTWTIDGRTVRQSELAERSDVHWDNQELAILTVRKPGGLELGIHEVAVVYQYSASYLPPRIDLQDGGGEPRRIVLGR
jgi:hypothetical protein